MRTIELVDDSIKIIDQTLLPEKLKFIKCNNAEQVSRAIEQMKIRGAPALGAAAGMALAVTALRSQASDSKGLVRELEEAAERVSRTRPTAQNLFQALDRVMEVTRKPGTLGNIRRRVVREAERIAEEDIENNRKMGRIGAKFIGDGDVVLTHCNAGALATVDYGTALGTIRSAQEEGKDVIVYATETRPFCQGARLTAWELKREGIPVTLIADSAVGYLMSRGEVDLVMVGADRVAANGDVVNKIGTYTIATLADRHDVPFFVAAPLSTIDLEVSSGDEIDIEIRDPREVTTFGEKRIAPESVNALNPAFDLTPASLITKIITERSAVDPSEIRSLFD